MAKNLEMTGRERVMAALAFEPVDKIPFVPLIDDYTLRDMSPEITGGLSPASLTPREWRWLPGHWNATC